MTTTADVEHCDLDWTADQVAHRLAIVVDLLRDPDREGFALDLAIELLLKMQTDLLAALKVDRKRRAETGA